MKKLIFFLLIFLVTPMICKAYSFSENVDTKLISSYAYVLDGESAPGSGGSVLESGCPSLPAVRLIGTLYHLLAYAGVAALIIFGMLDMGKAVAAGDEGQIKKAQSIFIKRLIAAVCIFLVVVFVGMATDMIGDSGVMSCVKAILG